MGQISRSVANTLVYILWVNSNRHWINFVCWFGDQSQLFFDFQPVNIFSASIFTPSDAMQEETIQVTTIKLGNRARKDFDGVCLALTFRHPKQNERIGSGGLSCSKPPQLK